MARSTLQRDYDIARILAELQREVAELRRRSTTNPAFGYAETPGGYDTGWVNITSWNAGVTPLGGANTPQVRRVGSWVMLRGRCSTTGITGNFTMGSLPGSLALFPSGITELGRGVPVNTWTSRLFLNTDGTIGANGWASNATITLSGYGYGTD